MITIIGDPDGVPETRGGQSVRLFDTVRRVVAERVAAGGPEWLSEPGDVPESGVRPGPVRGLARPETEGKRAYLAQAQAIISEDHAREIASEQDGRDVIVVTEAPAAPAPPE